MVNDDVSDDNEAEELYYEYKDFEIKLFQNSGKWDYNISEITTEGYTSKLNLYETKTQALENAKRQIDNYN